MTAKLRNVDKNEVRIDIPYISQDRQSIGLLNEDFQRKDAESQRKRKATECLVPKFPPTADERQ